jgi:uncharacterized protein DUF3786
LLPPDEYAMWLERAQTGKNSQQLEKAHDVYMTDVKRIDPLAIAETTGGKYLGDGVPRVVIPFLHSWFVLQLLPYRLRAEHPEIDTLPLKVLTLQHFIAAAENLGIDMKVLGEWIDCRSLQDGAVMGAHFSKRTTALLAKFFGLSRDERIVRAMAWGGKRLDLADDGLVFHFFPRVPVALVNWEGDEEFSPYAKILYDVSASNYMPTHALVALTEFLIHRLAE